MCVATTFSRLAINWIWLPVLLVDSDWCRETGSAVQCPAALPRSLSILRLNLVITNELHSFLSLTETVSYQNR